MHLVVVGINHKTAGVEVREKCFFSPDSIRCALPLLGNYDSISGAVILSTCNRTEIYASTCSIDDGFKDVASFLCSYHQVSNNQLYPYLYSLNCHDAVIHLYKVASGLDSMVLGEYQIQGQLRDAYCLASELGTTDNYINKVFQGAISTGKRVRTETQIGKGSLSIANLAIGLVRKVIASNKPLSVLMVGAGKMAQLVASNLHELPIRQLLFANRDFERATEVAVTNNGIAIAYDDRYKAACESDVIIISTSSDSYTISEHELRKVMKSSQSNPRLFIDLSIPRNIDPRVNTLENCMLYCMDEINRIVDTNRDNRTLGIVKAQRILHEESEDYFNWYYKQIVLPTMMELKEKLEVLKHQTIASFDSEVTVMNDAQRRVIVEMLDTYSEKLIKEIMKNIKNHTSREDLIALAHTLRHSFDLDPMPSVRIPEQDLK